MLWASRRDCHEECTWWSRNEEVGEEVNDELIMKRQPSGTFYAKEYSPEYYDGNNFAGSFRVDRTTVTLRTPDDISGIKNDDIVKYQGVKWIVTSVQRKNVRNGMTEFTYEDNVPHFYYIQLRR